MTSISKDTIKSKVRLLLNEMRVNDSQFDTEADELDLNSIIEGLAVESLRFVHLHANVALVESDTNASSSGGTFDTEGSFLRLVEVSSTEWKKPVMDFITPDDPKWNTMEDAYIGGTTEYPIVGIKRKASSSTGEKTIVYYPKSSVTVSYLKDQTDWSNNKLSISSLLIDAFYFYLTGMVLSVLNDTGAQSAITQAMVLMGVEANKEVEQ